MAAEEAMSQVEDPQVTIIWPKQNASSDNQVPAVPLNKPVKKASRRIQEDDGPLNDTTAKLALRSKKTERLQRRLQKKESRRVKSEIKSFLDLPLELLTDVLGHLLPEDIFALLRVNQFSREFVLDNEAAIASRIIQSRYWVLGQCFPLPIPLSAVDGLSRRALLSDRWQERLKIHRNSYQHIQQIDPALVCTCMSCVLAWNNLNIVLDLAHWQHNLESRQPLPIIPRGRALEWNTALLEKHAQSIRKAMKSPIAYARILHVHLNTITRTIIRNSKWRRKGESKTAVKPRLYHLSDEEVSEATDEFLERSGPPSYQPIYMRDNYYTVEAFVPNRKWQKEEQVWKFYSKWPNPHLNDLTWLAARFSD